MMADGSEVLVVSFLVMPLVLVLLVLWAVAALVRRGDLPRRAVWLAPLALSLWLVLWGAVAYSGVLDVWDGFPPRALPAVALLFATSVWFARSRVGTALAHSLSFRWLIGFQVFRFPLELMLHRAMVEGLMPPQMSFEGLNFDIVSGLSAGVIALVGAWVTLPRWVYWAFNVMGTALLAVVVTIAIVSIPTFALFGPDRANTWVFGFPYLYLPAVMVQWALVGHLLVFRKLAMTADRTPHAKDGGSDSNWSVPIDAR